MSARTVIDGLEFSRAEDELQGHLPLAGLDRLQDCLFDADGGIDFLLKGGRDRQRRLVLHLEVNGLLNLQCQRCLEALAYPLRIMNRKGVTRWLFSRTRSRLQNAECTGRTTA
jgi:uncharacterized protein